jgi:hypothetical protein
MFALGVGGFLAAFWTPNGPATNTRRIIVATCFVAFIATVSVTLWQDHKQEARIDNIGKKVLTILDEKDRKSIDQIHELLFPEDFADVSKSLWSLMKNDKIGTKMVNIKDTAGLPYYVRLYYRIQ